MRVLIPGHRYALQNLKSKSETILQYYQDPRLHDGHGAEGPSCQEVIRSLIDRVQVLHEEKPWILNRFIIQCLRMAIVLFEMRALYYKVYKDGFAIESLPIGEDGHIMWKENES